MFFKYYFWGLLQLAVLFYVAPLVIGVFYGMFGGAKADRRIWPLAVGLIALLNAAVVIDKGLPFFSGHLVDMFMPYPLAVPLRLLIGLIGDGLWLLLVRRELARGFGVGRRTAFRGEAAK